MKFSLLSLLLLHPCLLHAWSWSSSSSSKEDRFATPILNREIEASVTANWPTTPQSILCEAYVYDGVSFLDKLLLTSSIDITTFQDAWNFVKNYDDNPLRMLYLSTRASSPLCETHRVLARQYTGQNNITTTNVMFVIGDRVILEDLDDWQPTSLEDASSSKSSLLHLLPDEVILGDDNVESSLGVLYANLGTEDFRKAYQKLLQLPVRFVVRHLGAVHYEEDPSSAIPTFLQGYGMRLDIRNVEYKVFDDRRDREATEEAASLLNLTQYPDLTLPQFFQGVDLKAIGLDPKASDNLWLVKDGQLPLSHIVPPEEDRQKLSMQAATAILHSKDPLSTLREISQNLPTLASTLVQVHVPAFVEEKSRLLVRGVRGATGMLYVNGRPVPFDRPTFNMFEFLNIIREEEEALQYMKESLEKYLSADELKSIHEAWIQGESFVETKRNTYRIDVARNGNNAIIYLNDIERDPQYQDWPDNYQQMFMAMQFGQPPTIRKNLYNFLCVIDPFNTENNGWKLVSQLTQNGYPVRVGLLPVEEKDVELCRKWKAQPGKSEKACPVRPLFDKPYTLEELQNIPADTHALYRLISNFLATRTEPGALIAYGEYMLSMIEEMKDEKGQLMMTDLLQIHGQLMEGMGFDSSSSEEQRAAEFLLTEDEGDSTYQNAVNFAVSKGLKPGMSFINGRPLPVGSSEGVRDKLGEIFGEEQNTIMRKIMSREFTETSPRSIYSHFVTGSGVFKKVHPLLSTSEDPESQLFNPFEYSLESIALREGSLVGAKAMYLVDYYVDYGTTDGLEDAKIFLDALHPADADAKDIAIGYRIIPRTARARDSIWCPVFSSLSTMDRITLGKIIDRHLKKGYSDIEELLDGLSLEEGIKEKVRNYDCSFIPEIVMDSDAVAINGKVYRLEGQRFTTDDMELLLDLQVDLTQKVTEMVGTSRASIEQKVLAVGQAVAFLSSSMHDSIERRDILSVLSSGRLGVSLDDMQYYSSSLPEVLQIKISALIDPTDITTQRISDFLLLSRDLLRFPVSVMMAPNPELTGDSKIPITSYYRFRISPEMIPGVDKTGNSFQSLPSNHILTLRTDVPEPWDVQQKYVVQDTDNLRCDFQTGCSDDEYLDEEKKLQVSDKRVTKVEFDLKHLLFFGRCYEKNGNPPNGLQLTLYRGSRAISIASPYEAEIGLDGSIESDVQISPESSHFSDTLVMKNVGYWQLQALPGVWELVIAEDSKGAEMFDFIDGGMRRGRIVSNSDEKKRSVQLYMKDFVSKSQFLMVERRPGYEMSSLFYGETKGEVDDTIHVFSLATGHLYERFLKIMMLSVTKRTSTRVKFWLFENFLSPSFKASAQAMAKRIGCELEFVTYKWPEWLREQTEKQRIIWGYKILFLDVLFPLDVKKIIYVDADQVVRGDLKELWDMDLEGAPYGYTPFCTSREATLGYQFWREGFWKKHLQGKPYHISALYVVDLERFRKLLVGDQLRSIYQQLSADPNSLSNLDQDLPNYAQHQVAIHSLPQEWLWCESWCSDESKAAAKTIDLCNNPMHKEPKVSMAKRVISGPLFNESWVELDAEVEMYQKEYLESISTE